MSDIATEFEPVNDMTFREVTEIKHGHTRETIIGNSRSTSFEPMIEAKPWNEDCLRIWKDISESTSISSDLTNIKELIWRDSKEQITISPVMENLNIRLGGLFEHNRNTGIRGAKLTYLLNKKPKIGPDGYARFQFRMSGHEDMYFWRQPSLTEEASWPDSNPDLLERATRPEYVVESVAIYHKSRGGYNQYSTGKAGHLYRPWCQDSQGNFTWGKWEYDLQAGTLIKCIPAKAFDYSNATWWLVDFTFGNEASGASFWYTDDYLLGPYVQGSGYSPADGDGDVDYVWGYIRGDSANQHAKAALWNVADNSLLTNSETDILTVAEATEWQSLGYSGTAPSVLDANSRG